MARQHTDTQDWEMAGEMQNLLLAYSHAKATQTGMQRILMGLISVPGFHSR